MPGPGIGSVRRGERTYAKDKVSKGQRRGGVKKKIDLESGSAVVAQVVELKYFVLLALMDLAMQVDSTMGVSSCQGYRLSDLCKVA